MTNDETKEKVDDLYKIIADANVELKTIRIHCEHEDTYIGDYSWRPGASFKAKMCSYCYEVVENLDMKL